MPEPRIGMCLIGVRLALALAETIREAGGDPAAHFFCPDCKQPLVPVFGTTLHFKHLPGHDACPQSSVNPAG